jgi:hypothetical protein
VLAWLQRRHDAQLQANIPAQSSAANNALGLTHKNAFTRIALLMQAQGIAVATRSAHAVVTLKHLTVLIVPRRSGSVDDTRADDWSSAQSLTYPQLMPGLTQVFSLQLQLSQPPLSLSDARDLRPTSSYSSVSFACATLWRQSQLAIERKLFRQQA